MDNGKRNIQKLLYVSKNLSESKKAFSRRRARVLPPALSSVSKIRFRSFGFRPVLVRPSLGLGYWRIWAGTEAAQNRGMSLCMKLNFDLFTLQITLSEISVMNSTEIIKDLKNGNSYCQVCSTMVKNKVGFF